MSFDRLFDARADLLRTEVAVIGSGPGGSITATMLAEAGRQVLLLEEGPWKRIDPRLSFTQAEMIQKYRNGGVTVALGPTKVAYVEGRCVGGGSEINSGLYHRTPDDVLDRWRREYRAAGLDELLPHFEACERELSVCTAPGPAPAASQRLKLGADRLGWKSLEVPRWQKYPVRSPSDPGVRQTMSETMIPRFLAAGGNLLSEIRIRRLRRHTDHWRLEAVHGPQGGKRRSLTIAAREAFVSCGALQTPNLLRRSGIQRNVGSQLRMHPTLKVVARFPEPVNALEMGVPVHQVKEFAPRISFGCSISRPPYLALAMADHPEHAAPVLADWQNTAIYYGMITGLGDGSVTCLPGFDDPLVRYRLAETDYRDLADALRELCRLLLAAGATKLYASVRGMPVLRTEADLDWIPPTLAKGTLNLMTIHLFSSCPMGENPRLCAADSYGKVHGVDGLYLADASLLCTAPGVNPQGSVMAVVRRNAARYLHR